MQKLGPDVSVVKSNTMVAKVICELKFVPQLEIVLETGHKFLKLEPRSV